jgi:S-DNA-T family DNA segregation ATPase FtsK/SpoIIIE
MLFQAPDAAAPVRLQGVFVGDSEIQRLVDYWRLAAMNLSATHPQQNVPGADPSIGIPRGIPLKQNPLWDENAAAQGDPLYADAVDLVRREGRASITMLQRRMRIGYTRAARLVDSMEEKGIIGPVVPNSQVREIMDYGPAAPPKED